jgi:hypothetical protein
MRIHSERVLQYVRRRRRRGLLRTEYLRHCLCAGLHDGVRTGVHYRLRTDIHYRLRTSRLHGELRFGRLVPRLLSRTLIRLAVELRRDVCAAVRRQLRAGLLELLTVHHMCVAVQLVHPAGDDAASVRLQ